MISDFKFKNDVYEGVIDVCSYMLRKDAEAEACRNYIDQRLSREAQGKYKIGYFPSSIDGINKLISFVGRKELEELSLIYQRYAGNGSVITGHFSDNNLIMPFMDAHGYIVSLLGRSILDSETQKENKIQKYKYSINADKELYVYGLERAKASILEKGYAICVEGQFDRIRCEEMGIHNVIAVGWATLSRYQLYQLSKYTDSIVLLFDNDEAGDKGRVAIKKRFGKLLTVSTMRPPSGYKDIDEFFQKEESSEKIDAAIKLLNNLERNGR